MHTPTAARVALPSRNGPRTCYACLWLPAWIERRGTVGLFLRDQAARIGLEEVFGGLGSPTKRLPVA